MMTIDLIYLVLGALGAGGIGVAGTVAALRLGPQRLRSAVLGTDRAGGHGDSE